MLTSLLKSGGRRAAEAFFPGYLVRRHHARFGAEEIEMSILDLVVPHGTEAIDVGANWGTYAAILSRRCRSVHCIEPNPRLARLLERTVPANVSVTQCAASSRPGIATLHIPVDGHRALDGLASLRSDVAEGVERVDVPAITLDTFADREIGFVKIDVEGFELEVLDGARALIAARHPHLLIEIEERHAPGAIAAVKSRLEAAGYDGWFIDQRRLHPIADFDAAIMQNSANLDGDARRFTQRYVNNFLFLPKGTMTGALRQAIDERLAAQSARQP